MEQPKIRYLGDATRFLDLLDRELDETGRLIKIQQKALASVLIAPVKQPVKAMMIFNVTPTDTSEQRKTLNRIKTKIDPSLTKVFVPNLKKLQSQYGLAEDLYEKLRTVESVETQLSLAFPNRRGEEYMATMNHISRMKTKISTQLKLCFQFLSEVADKHVPAEFKEYVTAIVSLLNEHVIFKDSHSFLYVSVSPSGDIVFTNYIMLQDVANDEGAITPHLYISVQWVVSSESPILTVDLNHEYEVPNKLLGSGEQVGDVGQAAKVISEMLEMENFSSALGVVPLALQLKVDPTSLNPNLFAYRDYISAVAVDERTITFTLRKEADSPELLTEVAAQLYKELKALMRTKGVRLTMRTGETKKGFKAITFNIVKVAEGGSISHFDIEYLRDKFGLSTLQLRRIANIINQGLSR